MADDARKCLDAGCDEHASKPINREELIGVCKQWAERKFSPTLTVSSIASI
jgi:CheY-like chemotaxis protein